MAEVDDEFNTLLEGIFDTVMEDSKSVKLLSLIELKDELDDLDAALTGQLLALNPDTQEARDLHSRRAAVCLEIKLRTR